MKRCLLLGFLCFSTAYLFSQNQFRDEFNGPFPSWANVKTRFKAAGDGKKDDTRALQMALDSVTRTIKGDFNTDPRTRYLVIYLPAGTYRISQTLRLEGKIGVTFIGEHPEKTIISWQGSDNDTMFLSNKSAFIKISRLTWNANNKNGIEAIGLHYMDKIEPQFAPTSIELSDMIFTGTPMFGLSCGSFAGEGTGTMDSEFLIKRCKFYACRVAGIIIKGFNALDYWIWDCEFNSCNMGVQCVHGNYHIYQSHFINSKVADLKNLGMNYSSVRGCYSKNAAVFSLDDGASCNTFKRVFQKNIIIDCKQVPIQYYHQGKITLMDNFIYNDSIPQDISVDYGSWCRGNYDMLSLENNFSLDKPYNVANEFPSKFHSIADIKFDSKKMKRPVVRPLEPFAPYIKRRIFEVPVNAGAQAIQNIINKAAELKGQRPVVHFPMGLYSIDRTIELPAGSDIQLIGDGNINASWFLKTGARDSTFYYFNIKGPSFVTIKDIQIGSDGNPDKTNAFLFTGTDQPNAEVRLDQIYAKAHTTINIDGLDYTYFEKNNSFFADGNRITGGDMVKAGKGTSVLYCFGGQSAGVHLENNATMVAKDCWWEGKFRKEYLPLDLTGYGNLTVDAAMYAPSDLDSGTTIQVSNFRGNLSLMNMYVTGGIDVKPGSPGLNMFVWNINHHHKRDPMQFLRKGLTSKIAMMGISSQCFKSHDKLCPDENPQSLRDVLINIPDQNKFIAQLTRDSRKAMPRPYRSLANGISNVFISRVLVYTGTTAYTFRK
ncbi:MAG: glycosyl hydrolase family 28-related protein [Chitinophagaceae bacterium]